jgi:hypothetical protein
MLAVRTLKTALGATVKDVAFTFNGTFAILVIASDTARHATVTMTAIVKETARVACRSSCGATPFP